MIRITKADEQYAKDLTEIQTRNVEFHKPWVFHSEPAGYFQKLNDGRTIGYFIWTKDTEELIGVINLNEPIMGIFQSAYLGYYIDAKFANKGYMTEALSQVISRAFTNDGFHRLEANIQSGNLHSIALVKRLGFQREGFSPKYLRINNVWSDHERWAIISDNWATN